MADAQRADAGTTDGAVPPTGFMWFHHGDDGPLPGSEHRAKLFAGFTDPALPLDFTVRPLQIDHFVGTTTTTDGAACDHYLLYRPMGEINPYGFVGFDAGPVRVFAPAHPETTFEAVYSMIIYDWAEVVAVPPDPAWPQWLNDQPVTLRFTGDGTDTLPPFERDLELPAVSGFTEPPNGDPSCVQDANGDFSFAWQPGDADVTIVFVWGISDQQEEAWFLCYPAPSATRLLFPETLARLVNAAAAASVHRINQARHRVSATEITMVTLRSRNTPVQFVFAGP